MTYSKTAAIADNRQQGVVGAIFRALVYAFAFAVILALLVYLGLSWDWIPIKSLKAIFMYGNFFAILAGAALAGMGVRGRGWMIGLVFGAAYFLLASVIAPAWGLQEAIVGTIFFTRLTIALILGVLGGMIGVNL